MSGCNWKPWENTRRVETWRVSGIWTETGRREGAKRAGIWGKAYVACYEFEERYRQRHKQSLKEKRKARWWKQEHTHDTALEEQPLQIAGEALGGKCPTPGKSVEITLWWTWMSEMNYCSKVGPPFLPSPEFCDQIVLCFDWNLIRNSINQKSSLSRTHCKVVKVSIPKETLK